MGRRVEYPWSGESGARGSAEVSSTGGPAESLSRPPGKHRLAFGSLLGMMVAATNKAQRKLCRVLDLGCGSLTLLPPGLNVDFVIGVDLLFDRLRSLHERGDKTPTVNADRHAFLPFPSGAFDAVVMSTMLLSVLAESARVAICPEVARVLAVDGALLWYDFRVRSIGNSATRPIHRAALRRYFSDLSGPVASLTVVPPLALPDDWAEFPAPMQCWPVRPALLRTHLGACLVKS